MVLPQNKKKAKVLLYVNIVIYYPGRNCFYVDNCPIFITQLQLVVSGELKDYDYAFL